MPISGSQRSSTQDRQTHLVTLMQAGVEQVDDLAYTLGVSASTVRRDLAKLTSAGRVTRTYGGAVPKRSFHERPVGDRTRVNTEAKGAIAAAAALFVGEEMTVFIDAGSTCLALAEQLHNRRQLSVVTRGLEVGAALASSDGVKVDMVGGTILHLSHGLVGPLALLGLERMGFDAAFLSADAVDPRRGVGEPTMEEAAVKEKAAAVSDRVFVIADSSKLRKRQLGAWTRLAPGWTLITDGDAKDDALAAFLDAGNHVIIAPSLRSNLSRLSF